MDLLHEAAFDICTKGIRLWVDRFRAPYFAQPRSGTPAVRAMRRSPQVDSGTLEMRSFVSLGRRSTSAVSSHISGALGIFEGGSAGIPMSTQKGVTSPALNSKAAIEAVRQSGMLVVTEGALLYRALLLKVLIGN